MANNLRGNTTVWFFENHGKKGEEGQFYVPQYCQGKLVLTGKCQEVYAKICAILDHEPLKGMFLNSHGMVHMKPETSCIDVSRILPGNGRALVQKVLLNIDV